MHNLATTYYARRAPYYEAIYNKPERQPDLAALKTFLKNSLESRNILEIACGTGYWTQVISETAESMLATDINEAMLELARQKVYSRKNVVFENRDMYALKPGEYDALFGGFIWSHIALEELEQWLDHLHGLVKPGSRLVFIDNNFVPGSNTPVSKIDDHGNIYQERMLADGTKYQIIKNFPERDDFERLLKGQGKNIRLENLKYYWVLEYEMS